MDVEQAFAIEIPNADAEQLVTVGLLFDYVRSRAAPGAEEAAARPYAGELWERYLDVVERSTGIPRRELRPGASWVYDLGLD